MDVAPLAGLGFRLSVSELVRGKINFFALDKLVNMAARAGLTVTLTVHKRELVA